MTVSSAGRLWLDAERVVLLTDPRYAERAANELAAVSYPGELEVVALSTDPAPVAAYLQPTPGANLPGELERTLQKLADLRDQGLLSVDEFEAKKRELLSRI